VLREMKRKHEASRGFAAHPAGSMSGDTIGPGNGIIAISE